MTTPNPHYWLIELLAWWEGRINTKPLCRYFGQSRQSASTHLNQYLAEHPNQLAYHTKQRVYLPTECFTPQYISQDVNEYLNWVTGISPAPPDNQLQHQTLVRPKQAITPDIIRPLVAAVRQQRRLDVEYLSVTSADTEGRIIAPHTFVNTGLRWHVRAFCERSNDYRDFVLSRFRGEPELQDDKATQTREQDTAWNTEVTLVLKPDPRLNDAKRQVIGQDYQMENGELHITTRGALVQYTLHSMQVNTKFLDGNPEAQQLVLANYAEVKAWLF